MHAARVRAGAGASDPASLAPFTALHGHFTAHSSARSALPRGRPAAQAASASWAVQGQPARPRSRPATSPGPLDRPRSSFTTAVGHAGPACVAGRPSGDVPGPRPATESSPLGGPPRTSCPARCPQPQPSMQLWHVTARWFSPVQLRGVGRWRERPLCTRCLHSRLPTARRRSWAHEQRQRRATADKTAA
jgi:hypothetical protein